MKTSIQTGLTVFSASSIRRLLPVLAAAFASLSTAAVPQPGAAEPKTHTLFMGADISIEQNKELYRVLDVVGSNFVVNVDGKQVSVPMDRGLNRFKVAPSLKLTEASASVANIKAERSYTLANDPTVQFERGMAASQFEYSDADYAQNLRSDILQNANNAVVLVDPWSGRTTADVKAKNIATATQNLGIAQAGPGSDFNRSANPGSTEGAFDAMNVAFEVSAEKPLDRPFIVIIADYRATVAKAAKSGRWVYARALQPIGPEAVKVHVEQGGFPPGFELRDLQVHLYNHGTEIATTAAPKRMELTRTEALQYVIIEYVGSHKGATLPPGPAMGRLPADLPARLAGRQFPQTFYVRVDKDGKATDAYSDQSCSHRVDDPYLQSAVQGIGFMPALENGRPVDGVAALNLGQLPI